jgi:hypothetical protein
MTSRGDGLRIRLAKIPGVTKGEAARILEEPYRFQCAPMDSFSIPKQRTFGRFTNYRGSEYLTRGGTALQVITFRTIAVEWGSFVIEQDWDVLGHVQKLQGLVDSGWPFDLLATHQYNREAELHIKAVLESATAVEEAGEQDARYLDLSFIQWRDTVVQRKSLRSSTAKKWPLSVSVQKDGDVTIPEKGTVTNATFAGLAKKVYGKASLGSHIAAKQKPPIKGFGMHTPIAEHPRFKKGGKLTIPEPPPTASINQPD